MARVPYREPEALDDGELLVSALQGRPLHVYQAIANNPAVLRGLRAFLSTLWTASGLTERRRELAILAAARATNSSYEWHQHVRIAGEGLVSGEELAAIAAGELDPFGPGDSALVAYAGAVAAGEVDDGTHAAAREALGDDATLVGAAAVAAGYAGLARLIDALGVELEPGEAFAGWTNPTVPG